MLKQGEVITIKGYRVKSEPFTASAHSVETTDRKQLSSADDGDGGPKQQESLDLLRWRALMVPRPAPPRRVDQIVSVQLSIRHVCAMQERRELAR
jgi:hypothetical protein